MMRRHARPEDLSGSEYIDQSIREQVDDAFGDFFEVETQFLRGSREVEQVAPPPPPPPQHTAPHDVHSSWPDRPPSPLSHYRWSERSQRPERIGGPPDASSKAKKSVTYNADVGPAKDGARSVRVVECGVGEVSMVASVPSSSGSSGTATPTAAAGSGGTKLPKKTFPSPRKRGPPVPEPLPVRARTVTRNAGIPSATAQRAAERATSSHKREKRETSTVAFNRTTNPPKRASSLKKHTKQPKKQRAQDAWAPALSNVVDAEEAARIGVHEHEQLCRLRVLTARLRAMDAMPDANAFDLSPDTVRSRRGSPSPSSSPPEFIDIPYTQPQPQTQPQRYGEQGEDGFGYTHPSHVAESDDRVMHLLGFEKAASGATVRRSPQRGRGTPSVPQMGGVQEQQYQELQRQQQQYQQEQYQEQLQHQPQHQPQQYQQQHHHHQHHQLPQQFPSQSSFAPQSVSPLLRPSPLPVPVLPQRLPTAVRAPPIPVDDVDMHSRELVQQILTKSPTKTRLVSDNPAVMQLLGFPQYSPDVRKKRSPASERTFSPAHKGDREVDPKSVASIASRSGSPKWDKDSIRDLWNRASPQRRQEQRQHQQQQHASPHAGFVQSEYQYAQPLLARDRRRIRT